jgi:hypothetical protein
MPYLRFGDETKDGRPIKPSDSDPVDLKAGASSSDAPSPEPDQDGHILLSDDVQPMTIPAPVLLPSSSSSLGARNATNTVSIAGIDSLTIMHWNIQTLGGGIGRSPLRDQPVIDAIAGIILAVEADICIITEVMQYGRPPSRPQAYSPSDIRVPRTERIANLKKQAAPLAKQILKALESEGGGATKQLLCART